MKKPKKYYSKQGLMLEYKYCYKCKNIKPVNEMQESKKSFDGYKNICKSCLRERNNNYYALHREKLCKRATEECKKRYKENKFIVFKHYGGDNPSCACCGEKIREFLTIDHVNNDGNKHRKEMKQNGSGNNLYLWLIKHDFPTNFQILCWNCNFGKAKCKDFICPHRKKVNSNE